MMFCSKLILLTTLLGIFGSHPVEAAGVRVIFSSEMRCPEVIAALRSTAFYPRCSLRDPSQRAYLLEYTGNKLGKDLSGLRRRSDVSNAVVETTISRPR